VVEDDPGVRSVAVRALRTFGYRVTEAPDGPTARRLIADGSTFDLLFTDVVMPGGMSGRVLADEARRLLPRLKVLFTSGYTSNAIVHHGRLDPGTNFIAKPYRRHDLAHAVRGVLDGDAGESRSPMAAEATERASP
jgi:CheY-like chemotaxis protein